MLPPPSSSTDIRSIYVLALRRYVCRRLRRTFARRCLERVGLLPILTTIFRAASVERRAGARFCSYKFNVNSRSRSVTRPLHHHRYSIIQYMHINRREQERDSEREREVETCNKNVKIFIAPLRLTISYRWPLTGLRTPRLGCKWFTLTALTADG